MTIKTKAFLITSLLLLNCNVLYAQVYSSNQHAVYSSSQGGSYHSSQSHNMNNGYSSSQSNRYVTSPDSVQTYQSSAAPHEEASFSMKGHDFHAHFSNNTINTYDALNTQHYHPHLGLQWISEVAGAPIPHEAVIGGGEAGQIYYVCRAPYAGGLHPGKIVSDRCNFSWGGREIRTNQYQVLVSHRALSWTPANFGHIPPRAIRGGHENGNPLFICQAQYHQTMQPGKIVGQHCLIAWGGREIAVPYYNVLVG